jgi:hypothetical protein
MRRLAKAGMDVAVIIILAVPVLNVIARALIELRKES